MPNNSQTKLPAIIHGGGINLKEIFDIFNFKCRYADWAAYQIKHFKLKEGINYHRSTNPITATSGRNTWNVLYIVKIEAAEKIVMRLFNYRRQEKCYLLFNHFKSYQEGGVK